MNELWVNKYAPKKTSDIIGQKNAIEVVSSFVKSFPNVSKKAVLVYGPTGTGKTCIAKSLVDEFNLELVEMNASDFRTKAIIEETLGAATRQASLFGTGKLILIDEVDNLSGTKDRGGVGAIAEIIEGSKFPIILTANDAYSDKLKSVRKYCTLVELKGINPVSIFAKLQEICKLENISYDEAALKKLAALSNNDMRAAITDLQIISEGRNKITLEDISLWAREQEESIFETLKVIFKSFDSKLALESFEKTDEAPEDLMLWIDQSIPAEYLDVKSRKRAYDYLSEADIFQTRIMRWQHWRFLVYINAFLSAGVQQSKDKANPQFILHKRPELLIKLFIRAAKRAKMKGLASQIGDKLHASSYVLQQKFMPYYQYIEQNNAKEFAELNAYLGLE